MRPGSVTGGGPQGLQGLQGVDRRHGFARSDGLARSAPAPRASAVLRASQGATGPRRSHAGCPAGPAGADRPAGGTDPGDHRTDGATGPAGSTGATGATGAAGSSGLSQYAYVYNDAAQTVAIEADVTFNKNGVLTAGITHAAGTPGAAGITLVNAGDYKVTFSVSGTEANQMALFVNGTLVPGTVYGSGAGTQQNTGQAIVTFAAGDVLTLRNHTSAAAVSLATPIGGTQANANASVVIEKLN